MKSKFFNSSLLASALFAGLAFAPAMAQNTNTPGIDHAQQAINARIQQGMASGHITPSEAQALLRRDREITNHENRLKSTGDVTPQERQQLRADLDALSAEVERMIVNRNVVGQPGNTNTPGIDDRQADINQRIVDGVSSGQINRRQAQRLQSRVRDVARMERRFKRDGVVTPQERSQLRSELTRLRDDVERLMGNERRG